MRHNVESEIQGRVWRLVANQGAAVAAGDVLLILESMKMEIPVEAPVAGRLVEMLVGEEEQIEEDQVLAVIDDNG